MITDWLDLITIIFFLTRTLYIFIVGSLLFVNNITMKHGINRQRPDPVMAPDQFGVTKPLGPEDLDRHVTSMVFTQYFLPLLEPLGVNMYDLK